MARRGHHSHGMLERLPAVRRLQVALDRARPSFSKGGRYERFAVLYEVIDGFLFTPAETTVNAPHVRDGIDLKRLMVYVDVAVFPCIVMALYNTGFQAFVSSHPHHRNLHARKATGHRQCRVNMPPRTSS